jgi:hypothetical protein
MRLVLGYVGPSVPAGLRKHWNQLLAQRGVDAFFDAYPARTREDLQQKLSEMFLLERRGYIVDPSLQPFLHELLDETPGQGSVDTVLNDAGVLRGVACNSDEERFELWFHSPMRQGSS